MPDRLADALANSFPRRHRLYCRQCPHVVTSNNADRVALYMRIHRFFFHRKGRRK